MPKHKGTDHLRAELRGRIAKLTQLLSKKSGAQRTSMAIDREGAAQIAVTGVANTGKSQLVASITNASPAVAEYPLTTHNATPGMMDFEDINIQLIDTPPLTPQLLHWWLPPLLRKADALLVMVDLGREPTAQLESAREQLEKMRIIIGEDYVKSEEDSALWLKKALVVGNKSDLDKDGRNLRLLQEKYGSRFPMVAISARDGTGIDELKQKIYRLLDIIRVYTKMPGQKADLTDPIVLPRGSTLQDAASAVHKDFAANLRYARLWGSGKHDGIMVKRDHVLENGDVIELHIKD